MAGPELTTLLDRVDAPRWPLVVSVVGPTAVGKSDLALRIAHELSGDVVNSDAFQLYRGMDIGTAKLDFERRLGVTHHLIDVLDIAQPLNAALFQDMGRAVLTELAGRGRPAVVVGGSGLYVRALLDDLRFPGSDPQVRRFWEEQLERLGPDGLHQELRRRDPAAAAAILPSNSRRVVRALEVGQLTVRPFRAELPKWGPRLVPHVSVGLDLDRPALDARIELRVGQMLRSGLVAEVAGLVERGLARAPTANRALGYAQVMDLLAGRSDEEQARAEIVRATRRFARRQQRWFRADPRTQWFDRESSTDAQLLDHVVAAARTVGQ